MSAVIDAYQSKFAPVVADLPDDDQKNLLTLMCDGVGSYLNYIAEAFVKRDVTSSTPANVVESLQKNIDNFRRCLDQSLATAVGDVNEKHLQPVFTVIGDQLNRFSKAFDDLTATSKKPDPDIDF